MSRKPTYGHDEHGPTYPEPLDPRCPVCLQDNDWCMQDNCPGRNRLPPHEPANVVEFHRRIAARHEKHYLCDVCRTSDRDSYLNCSHPMCPDGHDQGPRGKYTGDPSVKCAPCLLISTLLLIALVGALLFACVRPAAAFDHGFDKTTARSKFFAQLRDPTKHYSELALSEDTKSWFGELKRQDKMPDSCCGEADAYEADIFQRNPKTAREPWGSYDVTITNGEDDHPWPDGTHRTPIKNGTVIHVPGNRINPPQETKNNPTGHSWLFVSTKRDIDGSIAPDHSYCFAPLPEGT